MNKEQEKTMYINMLIDAIEDFSEFPEKLENFKNYLDRHFSEWCEKFANTPQNFINELHEFANVKM